MEDSTFASVQRELNNPDSIYYLGGPSSYEKLQNFLNGYGINGINTNYFGKNAKNYLARAEQDAFVHNKIMQDIDKRNKWETGLLWAGVALTTGLAYIFRGKIPFIGKFLKKT